MQAALGVPLVILALWYLDRVTAVLLDFLKEADTDLDTAEKLVASLKFDAMAAAAVVTLFSGAVLALYDASTA